MIAHSILPCATVLRFLPAPQNKKQVDSVKCGQKKKNVSFTTAVKIDGSSPPLDSDRSAKTERQVKRLNKSRCCGDGIWCLGPDLTPVSVGGGYSNCVFIQIVWWLQGPERSADGPGKRRPARSSDARGYQGEDFYLWLHSCRGLGGRGVFLFHLG